MTLNQYHSSSKGERVTTSHHLKAAAPNHSPNAFHLPISSTKGFKYSHIIWLKKKWTSRISGHWGFHYPSPYTPASFYKIPSPPKTRPSRPAPQSHYKAPCSANLHFVFTSLVSSTKCTTIALNWWLEPLHDHLSIGHHTRASHWLHHDSLRLPSARVLLAVHLMIYFFSLSLNCPEKLSGVEIFERSTLLILETL